MANRSNASELERRIDAAAALLADGLPRTAAVSQLAERYRVDRRTARRYVAEAAALITEEIGADDIRATLAASVDRLQRLAWLAERNNNLSAAVGAERAAVSALVGIYRADWMAAARLNGHTIATAEPDEPTDRQRRRYRETTNKPRDAWPF